MDYYNVLTLIQGSWMLTMLLMHRCYQFSWLSSVQCSCCSCWRGGFIDDRLTAHQLSESMRLLSLTVSACYSSPSHTHTRLTVVRSAVEINCASFTTADWTLWTSLTHVKSLTHVTELWEQCQCVSDVNVLARPVCRSARPAAWSFNAP